MQITYILQLVSPTGSQTCNLLITSPALYHWAIQPRVHWAKNYLCSFPKHLIREYREKTTTSRIFMPCNFSSCRVCMMFPDPNRWKRKSVLWTLESCLPKTNEYWYDIYTIHTRIHKFHVPIVKFYDDWYFFDILIWPITTSTLSPQFDDEIIAGKYNRFKYKFHSYRVDILYCEF